MRSPTPFALLLSLPLLMGFRPQAAEHAASGLAHEIEKIIAEHRRAVKTKNPPLDIKNFKLNVLPAGLNEKIEKNDLEEWVTLSPQEQQLRGSKGLAESQARTLARKLDTDISADADAFEKENRFFTTKKCKAAYLQMLRGAVCLELHTKVAKGRLVDNGEWGLFLSQNAGKVVCQPDKKVSESIRTSRAMKKVVADIAGSPDIVQKFELAAIDCGCG